MPGFEEVTDYRSLFSTDEWESLRFGSWVDPSPDDDLSFASGVAVIDGIGRAASSQAAPGAITSKWLAYESLPASEVLPELEICFVHEINCSTRQTDDGATEYVLTCDICDEIGTAEDYEEADVIAQQHKTFTAENYHVGESA
jgi:hypothetical protein